MLTEAMKKKVILTNIPNYYITDENCENLYYKAIANGIGRVIIGPSSMKTAESFSGRGVKTGVAAAYPSGASCPELKAQEICDCESESAIADMYYVTAAEGYFMSGHADNLRTEMKMCVDAVNKPVYMIIEAAEMPDEYLKEFCRIAKEEKIAGILLSTAFMPYDIKRPGVEELRRINKYAGEELEIIAAGAFESETDVVEAIEAGADAVMINESCKIVKV